MIFQSKIFRVQVNEVAIIFLHDISAKIILIGNQKRVESGINKFALLNKVLRHLTPVPKGFMSDPLHHFLI